MEKQLKVQPILTKYICDKCNTGELLPIENSILFTDPPKFIHRCNNCNNEMVFTNKFPQLSYITLEYKECNTRIYEGVLNCGERYIDDIGSFPNIELDNENLAYTLEEFDGKKIKMTIE